MERIGNAMSSIYLHCDQHENHHLRIIMDMIFGNGHFQNEIAWCYTGASGTKTHFPRKHDSILFYGKKHVFNRDAVRIPYAGMSRQRDKYASLTSFGEREPGWLNEKGKVVEDYWTDIQVVMNHSENITKKKFMETKAVYSNILDSENIFLSNGWMMAVIE